MEMEMEMEMGDGDGGDADAEARYVIRTLHTASTAYIARTRAPCFVEDHQQHLGNY